MKQYNDKALDSLMTTNREQVQEFNSTSLGYWAAHEQYSMHDLLRFVVEAEKMALQQQLQVTISILGGMIMLMVILLGYG
ncbi:MAG: hypothetical protein ACJ71K_13095 [Nitrososphaeraceae archaeon]